MVVYRVLMEEKESIVCKETIMVQNRNDIDRGNVKVSMTRPTFPDRSARALPGLRKCVHVLIGILMGVFVIRLRLTAAID